MEESRGNQTQEKLKFSQKIAYGLGHVLNDVISAMWFSYTLLFFEVVLKMPSAIAGGLIFLGQAAYAVASPVLGIIIDCHSTKKFWHILGTLLTAFTFPLSFSNCPWLSDVAESNALNHTIVKPDITWDNFDSNQLILGVVYFGCLIIVYQVGWAVVQIAHLSIIPEMTSVPKERANLTAIRYIFNFAAYVVVFLITWFILDITHGIRDSIGPNDIYKFRTIVMLGLIIGATCTLVFYSLLKAPENVMSGVNGNADKTMGRWFENTKDYFNSWFLYKVTLAYFMSRMILCINLIYMPLYLIESDGIKSEYIAIMPLVSYLASFLASLLVRQFTSHFSNESNFSVGAVIAIIGSIWIGLGYTIKEELFGMAFLLGSAASFTGVASLSLCANLIGDDTQNGAFIYSIVTAANKMGGGFVILTIEGLKSRTIISSSKYYQNVLSYGCGLAGVLGLIILYTIPGHSKKKFTVLNEIFDKDTNQFSGLKFKRSNERFERCQKA